MEKRIDLTQNVYRLTQTYPELIDILASLGFAEIKRKAVRASVGKLITIPKGATMKGIDIGSVVRELQNQGFTLAGQASAPSDEPVPERLAGSADDTTEQIKSLLRRLNDGESLESVRADFVRDFKHVPANDIMRAEQELIREGQTVKEVKKLCDVHSALFHTKAANVDLHHGLHHDQEAMMTRQAADNKDRTAELLAVKGHPLRTFYLENKAIINALDNVAIALSDEADVPVALNEARSLAVHYAKKGDLIYPLLKTEHGIYGPSQVMWTIDDEIRADLSSLLKQAAKDGAMDDEWKRRVGSVLDRAREMTFKENGILYPVCVANFTETEWQQIYADSKAYALCLGVEPETWQEGEDFLKAEKQGDTHSVAGDADELHVTMPGGALTLAQLTAMLDTLPLEITFVDADNINRYFNQPFAHKAFSRPLAALGREVFSCHPPKIEPMVRAIISDFREGKRDKVAVWTEKEGRATLVTYYAVRDAEGHYVGTMEAVQDMEEARKHFSR